MKDQLKECVRVLREEGGYDDLSDHGSSFGSGKDLYNVFIKPFTDVVSTAAAEVSKSSVRAQTLAKTAFETIATTLIPFLSSDYDEIWADEKERIDGIKAKYKDVYDATWTAFKDNDVMAAAFGYSPAAFLTKQALKNAPLPVLKTLNALTGGRLDGVVNRVASILKGRDTKKPIDRDSGGQVIDWVRRSGSQLHEVHVNDLYALLDNPKVKQAIASNPLVKRMQGEARKGVRDSLAAVYARARGIASAKGPEDIERITKKKVPGLDKLKKLPDKERAEVGQQVMSGVKKSALRLYANGLEARVKKAVKAGVPQDHPYVADHVKTLQKIKAL